MKVTSELTGTAIMLFAALSCSVLPKENPFDKMLEDGHLNVVAANGELPAKTVVTQDGTVLWSPYDSISVFYGICDLGKFKGQNPQPVKSTVFRSIETFAYGSISGGEDVIFWSVNPYSSDNSTDGESVTLSVPGEQVAKSGTFAPGSFPSIAKSEELNFSFYNVCGGLKIKVQSNGIKTITFRGNNNETLAGKVRAAFDDDGHPYVIENIDSKKQVSLVCPDGFVPGEWYFISMLPASLSKGFTLDFSNGVKSVSYVSEKNTTVKRSIFGVLSNVDEGLSLEEDWKSCDFLHKSLLLAIPNCSYSSVFISTEDTVIATAKSQSSGNIEALQIFANGPAPTENVSSFLSAMNITTVPYELTDYRQRVSGNITPYYTYLSTPSLYGTTSGIAVNSYFSGNRLTVETSLYFKKADDYKLVVALAQDQAPYLIYTNSGANTPSVKSDGVTRYFLTDILGDPLTVVSDNIVLYRSFTKEITNADYLSNLRVVVYILRPYGERQAVTNGSFGSCYVDNVISVNAGGEVELPVIKKINSEIGDFEYGGTIK